MKKFIKYTLVVCVLLAIVGVVAYSSVNELGKTARILNAEYAKETSPNNEYIVLELNPTQNSETALSNFYLENNAGLKIKFPKGATLPLQGKINETSEIKVKDKATLIVSSGKSPIGVSFQENKCTGYLDQFQNYYPSLENQCPPAEETVYRHGVGLLPDCEYYVKSLPNCETKLYNFPEEVSPSCQAIVRSYIHYNSCVESHENDDNFYLPVWRLYLNSKEEIWAASDVIKLFDQSGALLDLKELHP